MGNVILLGVIGVIAGLILISGLITSGCLLGIKTVVAFTLVIGNIIILALGLVLIAAGILAFAYAARLTADADIDMSVNSIKYIALVIGIVGILVLALAIFGFCGACGKKCPMCCEMITLIVICLILVILGILLFFFTDTLSNGITRICNLTDTLRDLCRVLAQVASNETNPTIIANATKAWIKSNTKTCSVIAIWFGVYMIVMLLCSIIAMCMKVSAKSEDRKKYAEESPFAKYWAVSGGGMATSNTGGVSPYPSGGQK